MLLLLAIALVVLSLSRASAQVVKPVDPNKKADIDTKPLNFGAAQFSTISEPINSQPNAVLSKDPLNLSSVPAKHVEFQSLEKPTLEQATLPQCNFTPKHLAVTPATVSTKKLDHAQQKAPINKRQIRPFAPGGEEELKKQLNEPH